MQPGTTLNIVHKSLLLLFAAERIHEDRFLDLLTATYTLLSVGLTCTELLHNARLFEFLLELLQGAVDAFAFFYRNDQHVVFAFST
jgi:hypothetical protein